MTVTGAEAASLVSAIRHRRFLTDEIESAFANEIKIEYRGNYWSVLNCAAYYNRFSILRLLLKNEKLINQRDLDTSLHIAAEQDHSGVVELLLKHEANIEYENNDGETPLLSAVKYENEDIVEILIEEGAYVNARDNFDRTSLHIACEEGFLRIVKLLLHAGAAINWRNASGCTPLFCAADLSRVNVVKLLIQRGADVKIPDNSRNTVLHVCVKRRNKVLIELSLQNGADVNGRNVNGIDIFHLAHVDYEMSDFAKFLVRLILCLNINTPKPEHHNSGGFLGFWDACKSELELMETCKIAESNISYKQLFLESDKSKLAVYLSNADIVSELDALVYKKKFPIYEQYFTENIMKGKSRLRLHYEADEVMNYISPLLPIVVRRKIYDYLSDVDFNNLINAKQHKCDKSQIMYVTGADAASLISEIRHRRFISDEIESAFANEIKIEYRRNYWSVLNCAAYYGNVSILRILLKNEKLIKQTDLDTSLCIAAEKDHCTVVEVLLKHEANIESENSIGDTTLLIAVKCGNENIVKILIDEKANVNAEDLCGNTSLHVACEKGFLGIIKLLLHAGAAINLQNVRGRTPLFCAADFNRVHVVKLLLHRGADVKIRDPFGSTVLHICFQRRNKVLTKLLLQNGADVKSCTNYDENDILDLAYFDFTDFSKFLISLILYLNVNTPISERHNSGDFSRFWDACKSELELMETYKIAESNISYRQLCLESNKSKLAAYLSNADVVSELDALLYKEKFPIYKRYFTENIMKGKSILRLHYEADAVMNRISPLLPIVVRRKIYNYLSDDDLKIFNYFEPVQV
ncbi:putative ankyrin repeat protein RF_0381 [Diabrotica virgifera virgifera]|uniref:Uncharacterized protein LOC114340076 n=1 Tax=Diabrotica virgifera virgifera TaxID=50390 RepID=A0A6P7GL03_DIAVI|nr:putative ankyrin repeat protein RF_0381 [Diabrotica virgifera virgifera]